MAEEEVVKMTKTELKKIITDSYKEGLAKGQPPEDKTEYADAETIKRSTWAELLNIKDNEGV